jgi:phage tail-like protein
VSEPFSAYNFRVEIVLADRAEPLCEAAFAECDGLELRFDVRRAREGGDNGRERLLAGPASFGEVTLRRGMTASFDLWEWCAGVVRDPSLRADARVIMLAADGASEQAQFHLSRCLPVRLRAPRLDARDGVVAIEELVLACEALTLSEPAVAVASAKAELHEVGRREGRVVAQFNPSSLALARDDAGETLRFELWFETSDDVRRLTDPVAALAGRPAVRFGWGSFAFEGRITALEQQLDLFSPDGRPLRAALALSMRR